MPLPDEKRDQGYGEANPSQDQGECECENHFPYYVRGGRCQTIENEEYEESIKDVEECVACKAIINQDVHAVTSSRSCQHRQSIC